MKAMALAAGFVMRALPGTPNPKADPGEFEGADALS